MSFGGGRDTYTLEYLIKVTNQGGAGGLSQVNSGLTQVNTNVNNVAMSQQKLQMIQDKVAASNNKVIQGTQGVTKAMKGLAFGVLGIVTAGAEFVGMLSMWRQTTTAVAEAQHEVDTALKESGKNSKDYKDAINELNKANRWARMTFRNLMLSMFDMVPFFILTINGIVKLRNAYKFLREAQAEQAAMAAVLKKANIGVAESAALQNSSYLSLSKTQRIAKAEQALMITANEQLAASNLASGVAMNSASLSASKYSKGMVFAQSAGFKFSKEAIKTSAAMGGVGAAMTLATANIGKTEKSMGLLGRAGSGIKGTFANIGAAALSLGSKLGKIALVIGGIILVVEAWKNNWGGIGDIINNIGVRIGNIHPILKKVMDLFVKVGDTIDLVVHGKFSEAKDIWTGGSKEMADATQEMTDNQKKAFDELQQSIVDTSVAGADLVTEFVEMDKKARKTFLFEHAIKGGAKSRFTDVAKDLDKLRQTFSSFADDMELIRLDETLGNWFDLPASFYKKVEFTFEDRFKKLGKAIGDKGLTNLGKEMEKAAKAKKGFEGFKQAVINAVKFDPTLMSKLKVFDPDAYAQFKIILDEAAAKLAEQVNKSKLGSNAWTKGTILDPNAGETKNEWFGTPGSSGAKNLGGGNAGILQPIVDAIKKGVEALPGLIKAVDWASVGTALRESILSIFSIPNAVALGTWFNTNLISPIFTALGTALKPEIEAFRKDPLGYVLGVANKATEWIGNFVAGLFGYTSELDMFGDIEGKINTLLSNNEGVMILKQFVNDPIGTLVSYFKGTFSAEGPTSQAEEEAQAANSGVSGILAVAHDILLGTGILNFIAEAGKAYDEAVSILSIAGDTLGRILNDPIGFLIALFDEMFTPGTYTNELITATGATIMDKLGITNFLDETVKMYNAVIARVDEGIGDLGLLVTDPYAWLLKHLKSSEDAKNPVDDLTKNVLPTLPKNVVPPGTKQYSTVPTAFDNPIGGIGEAGVLNNMPENVVRDKNGNWIDLNTGLPLDTGKRFASQGSNMMRGGTDFRQLNQSWQYNPNQLGGDGTMPKNGPQPYLGMSPLAGVLSSSGGETLNKFFGSKQLGGTNAADQQKGNLASADIFKPMIEAAAAASKGIQTEFSSMFTALQGIFTGIATFWSAQMNSFATNAASGNSQVQTEFSSMFTALTGIFTGIATFWSAQMNSFGVNATVAYTAVYSIFTTLINNTAGLFNLLGGQWNFVLTNMIAITETVFNTPLLTRWSEMFAAIGQTFTLTIDSWTLTMTTMIENTETIFNEPLLTRWSEIFTVIGETFTAMSEAWTAAMELFTEDSENTMEQLTETWGDVFNAIGETFTDMDDAWAESMESFIDEGVNAMDEVTNTWGDAFNAIGETFDDMVSAWEDSMSDMESAASSAVSNILSSMKKLNTTFTTIHEIRTIHTGGGIVAKGGLMSFAQGGSISAAGGKMLTTYGPQQFTIGDNPGGRESIWAIPHNNPGPTVAKIDKFYKPGHGGEGNITVFNGMVNLRISGNDIINDTKLNRRIKMTVGENRDRFG